MSRMRKAFHIGMVLLCLASATGFLYEFTHLSPCSSLAKIFYLFFASLITGIMSIMIEPRPRTTQRQREFDDKCINQGFFSLVLLVVGVIIIVFIASVA